MSYSIESHIKLISGNFIILIILYTTSITLIFVFHLFVLAFRIHIFLFLILSRTPNISIPYNPIHYIITRPFKIFSKNNLHPIVSLLERMSQSNPSSLFEQVHWTFGMIVGQSFVLILLHFHSSSFLPFICIPF